MSKSAGYDYVLRQMKKAQSRDPDGAGAFWATVEGVANAIDGVTGGCVAGLATGAMESLVSASGKEPTVTPNPLFVRNGHDDGDIRYTQSYFRRRKYKGLSGSAIGMAGAVGSVVTQADVAGILQHGSATGSTVAHLMKLHAIGKKMRKSETITRWVEMLVKMKTLKAGIRGAQLTTAAIPIGGLGIAGGSVAAAAKIGVALTLTKACLATSSEIHWRAFQEQIFSGRFGGGKTGAVGPASSMVHEIFTRRGATRFLGSYDVARIIKEPTGWLMLNDKLMLI